MLPSNRIAEPKPGWSSDSSTRVLPEKDPRADRDCGGKLREFNLWSLLSLLGRAVRGRGLWLGVAPRDDGADC